MTDHDRTGGSDGSAKDRPRGDQGERPAAADGPTVEGRRGAAGSGEPTDELSSTNASPADREWGGGYGGGYGRSGGYGEEGGSGRWGGQDAGQPADGPGSADPGRSGGKADAGAAPDGPRTPEPSAPDPEE